MILPRYTLERVKLPTSNPGSIYDSHRNIIAKTLELPWRNNIISSDPQLASCIPLGIYLVIQEAANPTRMYPYFRFVFVPGRHWHPDTNKSSVLIHRGNHITDLLGCIIPGSRHRDINNDGIPDIEESSKKLTWMILNMPSVFELEIRMKAA